MRKIDNTNYQDIANEVRRFILRMHAKSGSSHIASSFSCVEILVALYFGIMRLNPSNPFDPGMDRFILSKGHAASALYAVLALRGFFPKKFLSNYCMEGGIPGHSSKGCLPGVEVTTGSLGHGLSMGVGIALAGKHDKADYRVFVLLSDGECEEGSVWEAAIFASHHHLDNLVAIVDYNKMQALGPTERILSLEPFAEKWKSFNWEVKEIQGHNIKEIIDASKEIPFSSNKPSVLIAHTIKGKGVSFMENNILWHYKSPGSQELKLGLKELRDKRK